MFCFVFCITVVPVRLRPPVHSARSSALVALAEAASEKSLTANAGAIAFLATTGVGLDAYLYRYMRELYVSIAKDNYGNSFAFQMKKAIAVLDKKSDNLFDEYVSYQMNLNGDPCLKVTSFDKPEIEIHEEDVFFTPKNIKK